MLSDDCRNLVAHVRMLVGSGAPAEEFERALAQLDEVGRELEDFERHVAIFAPEIRIPPRRRRVEPAEARAARIRRDAVPPPANEPLAPGAPAAAPAEAPGKVVALADWRERAGAGRGGEEEPCPA